MMRVKTDSAAETRSLGEKLAMQLKKGDVILLFGEMGAGKSELTRGIAGGLGIEGHVTSPTFTILQVYEGGRLPLYHFDWYRVADAQELYELSMEEYLYGDGAAVVEWPERAQEAIPAQHLAIRLTSLGEDQREMILEPVGGFRSVSGWLSGGEASV